MGSLKKTLALMLGIGTLGYFTPLLNKNVRDRHKKDLETNWGEVKKAVNPRGLAETLGRTSRDAVDVSKELPGKAWDSIVSAPGNIRDWWNR